MSLEEASGADDMDDTSSSDLSSKDSDSLKEELWGKDDWQVWRTHHTVMSTCVTRSSHRVSFHDAVDNRVLNILLKTARYRRLAFDSMLYVWY